MSPDCTTTDTLASSATADFLNQPLTDLILLHSVNKLLTQSGLPPLHNILETSPYLLILLYESHRRCRVPDVDRSPCNNETFVSRLRNLKLFVGSVVLDDHYGDTEGSERLLAADMKGFCKGNPNAIRQVLGAIVDVFSTRSIAVKGPDVDKGQNSLLSEVETDSGTGLFGKQERSSDCVWKEEDAPSMVTHKSTSEQTLRYSPRPLLPGITTGETNTNFSLWDGLQSPPSLYSPSLQMHSSSAAGTQRGAAEPSPLPSLSSNSTVSNNCETVNNSSSPGLPLPNTGQTHMNIETNKPNTNSNHFMKSSLDQHHGESRTPPSTHLGNPIEIKNDVSQSNSTFIVQTTNTNTLLQSGPGNSFEARNKVILTLDEVERELDSFNLDCANDNDSECDELLEEVVKKILTRKGYRIS